MAGMGVQNSSILDRIERSDAIAAIQSPLGKCIIVLWHGATKLVFSSSSTFLSSDRNILLRLLPFSLSLSALPFYSFSLFFFFFLFLFHPNSSSLFLLGEKPRMLPKNDSYAEEATGCAANHSESEWRLNLLGRKSNIKIREWRGGGEKGDEEKGKWGCRNSTAALCRVEHCSATRQQK